MGTMLVGVSTLSVVHPEQNPALAGQSIYKSREVQDKQVVRILGTVRARQRCTVECGRTWEFVVSHETWLVHCCMCVAQD